MNRRTSRNRTRRRPPPPQYTLAGLMTLVTVAAVVFAVMRQYPWAPAIARGLGYFVLLFGPGWALLVGYLFRRWYNPWFIGLLFLCLLFVGGSVAVYYDFRGNFTPAVHYMAERVALFWVGQIVLLALAPIVDRYLKPPF